MNAGVSEFGGEFGDFGPP